MERPQPFVFVCGSSRSGTTMMSRILGNHTQVMAFQELHFFDELCEVEKSNQEIESAQLAKLLSILKTIQREGYFGKRDIGLYHQESISEVNDNHLELPLETFLHFLVSEAKKNGKLIPCEQTPQTVFAMDFLLRHIPDSRFIVMVRDPREVLLSQKGKWKRRQLSGGQIPFWESVRSRINYHPITISRIWRAVYSEALKHYDDSRVLFIRYEDLTNNPDRCLETVCAHLGLSFDARMLDVPVVGSSNYSDTKESRGVEKTRRGKWREGLNSAEIRICEDTCKPWMDRFEYGLSGLGTNRAVEFLYQFILPFQLSLALLFNLKRLKRVKGIWRRFINKS
jgi:hypothetical protein